MAHDRVGTLTSVCGFASLLPSGFPGLSQLGLYSIAGLIVAAAVTRFVLPSLMPAALHIRDLTALGEGAAHILRRARAARWLLWFVAIAAALWCSTCTVTICGIVTLPP